MIKLVNQPFSVYRRNGHCIYLTGQIGIKDGILVQGGIASETRQALQNIEKILLEIKEPRLTMNNILDMTVLLVDQNDYTLMNEVYKTFWRANLYPARTCYIVQELFMGARVLFKAVVSLEYY